MTGGTQVVDIEEVDGCSRKSTFIQWGFSEEVWNAWKKQMCGVEEVWNAWKRQMCGVTCWTCFVVLTVFSFVLYGFSSLVSRVMAVRARGFTRDSQGFINRDFLLLA